MWLWMHGMSGVPRKKFELCASIACIASLSNDKYFLIRRIARITASDAAYSFAIFMHYIILWLRSMPRNHTRTVYCFKNGVTHTHAIGFCCYKTKAFLFFNDSGPWIKPRNVMPSTWRSVSFKNITANDMWIIIIRLTKAFCSLVSIQSQD